jgi:hypothetical protein
VACVGEGRHSEDCSMNRREAGTALGSVLSSDRQTEEEEAIILTVTHQML